MDSCRTLAVDTSLMIAVQEITDGAGDGRDMGTNRRTAGEKIKVIIVDDDPTIRQVLRLLLRRERDIQVVGEATDGFDAVRQAREHAPDVVVMDAQMPNLDGIEATRQIKLCGCSTSVVVLTVYLDRAVEALAAGAFDCLCKATPRTQLLGSIRQAAARARGAALGLSGGTN